MSWVDLHLHTVYSDGTYTPAELIRKAVEKKFAAIAVTDHDTLDAIPDALAAGTSAGIEVVPGVEITCRLESQEMHLLGYFFGDTWRDESLNAVLSHAARVRSQRIEQMVQRLNQVGLPVEVSDVMARSSCGTVGRPHVAQALVVRGHVKDTGEAFARFLKKGKPGYVERPRMEASEAIGHIRRAGGVAVIAHPGLLRMDLPKMRVLKDQGMAGIEVWHTRHSATQSERFLEWSRLLDLVATGGSDCHGNARGEPLLGKVRVPYEQLGVLRKLSQQTSA